MDQRRRRYSHPCNHAFRLPSGADRRRFSCCRNPASLHRLHTCRATGIDRIMPSNDSSFWPLATLQLLSASVLLGLIFAAPGPWDLQRLGGAVLAFVSLCRAWSFAIPIGPLFFSDATSQSARNARHLFSNSKSYLCVLRLDDRRNHPCTPPARTVVLSWCAHTHTDRAR